MESQIKASFIPQDVGKARPAVRRMAAGGSDLIVLASIILMVASVALAAAVFLYAQFLQNSIVSKQDSIDRARASLEPALIEELSRLDARMGASDTLLQRHVAPSILFDLLEQITLQSIALTDLSVSSEGLDTIKISMKGEAQSVNSIALQSDLYGRSGVITSPIFSDINRATDGLMHFKVDAILNPNAMRYARLVEAVPSTQTQTNTTTQPVDTSAQQQPSGASTTTPQGAGAGPSFTPVN